jgi:outer membrane murein-binding lipoprotein Lpp
MPGLGGRSPRREGEEGDDDGSTYQADEPELAIIDGWIRSGRSKDLIVQQIQQKIDQRELREAASRIRAGGWTEISVPQESRENYSRTLAENVFEALVTIQQQNPLKVQFWISAKDLGRIPGVNSCLDVLDETAVSGRLNVVDTNLQLILNKLEKTDQLETSVTSLAATVTSLQKELRDHQAAAAAGAAASRHQVFQGPTWADRVSKSRLQGDLRDRSPSVKRGRGGSHGDDGRGEAGKKALRRSSHESGQELEQARLARVRYQEAPGSDLSQGLAQAREESEGRFQVVQFRRSKKSVLNKGSSQVVAEGGEQAPCSVFLSGTSPTCTADQVREKLLLCAAALGGDQQQGVALEISSIDHIPIKIPQGETPRSKCWKVTVHPRFAEHMAQSQAYPAAWGWRRWSRGPSVRASAGESQQQGRGVNVSDGGA